MRTKNIRLRTLFACFVGAVLPFATSAQWLPGEAPIGDELVVPNEDGWVPELSAGTERITALSPDEAKAAMASLNCVEYCGTPVNYATNSGNNLMQEFTGLRVRVLVPRAWFDFPSFTIDARHRFIDSIDAVHQYLNEMVGRRPSTSLASVTYVNPSACGSACGAVGGNWITVSYSTSDPSTNWLWPQQTGLVHYGEVHELTHNYDLLGGVDRYSGMSDGAHYWTSVMTWIYPYSYTSIDPNYLPNQRYIWNTRSFYRYLVGYPRTGMTFQNCVINSQCPDADAAGWGIANGLLQRLAYLYGAAGATRYTAFLRDKRANEPPQNAQDRLDNHFEAYSATAGRNLNCLWDQLGWRAEGIVSQRVIDWNNTHYPAPNPDCTNGQNGMSRVLDFRDTLEPMPTPNNYTDSGAGFDTTSTSPKHVTFPATINSHGMANRDQYFEVDGTANRRINVFVCSPTGFTGRVEGGASFPKGGCAFSQLGPSTSNIRIRQTGSGTDTRPFTIAAVAYVPPAIPAPGHAWAQTVATRDANGMFTISLTQIDPTFVEPGATTVRFWVQNFGWVRDVPLPAGWPNVTTMSTTWTPPAGTNTEGLVFRAKASYPLIDGVPPNGYASYDSKPFFFRTTTKPALQLRQTVDPLPLMRGAAATYTLTLTNLGSAATSGPITLATNFAVAADATRQSIGGANWTCTAATPVACTFNGTLSPGESAVLIDRVTVSATVGNSVSRTATYSGGGDLDCTAATPCSQSMTTNTLADTTALSVTSSADPSPLLTGHAGQFLLTVINDGGATTNAPITLTNTLPSGVSLLRASGAGWSCTGTTTLTCTYRDTLSYKQRTMLTLDFTVAAGPSITSVTNTATISGGGNFICANETSCTSTLTAPVSVVPALSMTFTNSPSTFTAGQAASYVIRAMNNGATATTAPIKLFFPNPGYVTFTPGTGTNWDCPAADLTHCTFNGTLAPGQNTTVTFNGTVASNVIDRMYSNATISEGGDPDCPPSACWKSLVTMINGGQPKAALRVTQSIRSAPLSGGGSAIYDIVVANTSTVATIGEIALTDTLPGGTSFVSAIGTDWTCTRSGMTLTCKSSTPIQAQQSSTVVLTLGVNTNAPATLRNTAQVRGGNDRVCPNGPMCTSTLDTAVTQAPMLAITQVALPDRFTAGQPATYAITIENRGAVATNGTLTFSDTVPTGATVTQVAGAGWNCQPGATTTCTRSAPLGSGDQSDITLTLAIPANATTGQINRVQISGGGDSGCPAGARCKSTLNTPIESDLIFFDGFNTPARPDSHP